MQNPDDNWSAGGSKSFVATKRYLKFVSAYTGRSGGKCRVQVRIEHQVAPAPACTPSLGPLFEPAFLKPLLLYG